jgi:signal transduction histidine kinase
LILLKQESHTGYDLKIYKIILFCLIFISVNAIADKTHPVLLKNGVQFAGGELIVDTSDQLRTFFIRPNWTNSLEVVSTWIGFDNARKIGKSLGNLQIQKAFLLDHNLMILAVQSSNLLLIELDSSLNQLNNITIETFEDLPEQSTFDVFFKDSNSFYIKVNSRLYIATKFSNLITIEKNSDIAESFALIHNNSKYKKAIVEKFSDFNLLYLYTESDSLAAQLRISTGDKLELIQLGNFLISKSSLVGSNSTLLEIINLNSATLAGSNYFDCTPENLICREISKDKFQISYLTFSDNFNIANIYDYSQLKLLHNYSSLRLPAQVYEPISLNYANSLYFALFRNFIVAYDENLNIKILDQIPIGKSYTYPPLVIVHGKYLILQSKLFSEKYELKSNHFWLFFSLISYLGVYLIPILLILIIYYFYKKYKKQKQLLNELLDLQSSGLMIILNKNGEMTRLNKQARELLGIDLNIPLQKPIRDYLTMDFVHALGDFIDEALTLHQNSSKKIVIVKENLNYEFVFSVSPIWSLSGNLKGYLINGYDITEQLERKRLSNWAQLAHDMQTNLLTIRLNAEQMSCERDTENFNRIGKILFQVNLLQKRVRDIVTVGRSSKLELMHASSHEIFNEISKEFDKAVFPDISITITGNDFDIYCDKPKLIRAIRNAVENGIKAIPEQNGTIELGCWTETQYHCFKIKDSGVGLDEQLKKRILTPYFTTSKDGSGFGLGTMIIQQVVELHRGKLQINSEPDKGTEFILKIPRNLLLKEK